MNDVVAIPNGWYVNSCHSLHEIICDSHQTLFILILVPIQLIRNQILNSSFGKKRNQTVFEVSVYLNKLLKTSAVYTFKALADLPQ